MHHGDQGQPPGDHLRPGRAVAEPAGGERIGVAEPRRSLAAGPGAIVTTAAAVDVGPASTVVADGRCGGRDRGVRRDGGVGRCLGLSRQRDVVAGERGDLAALLAVELLVRRSAAGSG